MRKKTRARIIRRRRRLEGRLPLHWLMYCAPSLGSRFLGGFNTLALYCYQSPCAAGVPSRPARSRVTCVSTVAARDSLRDPVSILRKPPTKHFHLHHSLPLNPRPIAISRIDRQLGWHHPLASFYDVSAAPRVRFLSRWLRSSERQ